MDKKLTECFRFIPLDRCSQAFMCKTINLPLICEHKSAGFTKSLEQPSKLYSINGDGNCLFRSFSYIVTGGQMYYNIIRHKILQHMADIENLLVPHMNMSLSSYVEHSNMINNGVWGSDIEIFAASSMLSTDIYVYTKTGERFTWQKFSRSMLDGSSPKNKCAIYLQHTNGVHYDVVLDVCSTIHGGTPKKQSRFQRKRKHVSVVEDCSTLYDPVIILLTV